MFGSYGENVGRKANAPELIFSAGCCSARNAVIVSLDRMSKDIFIIAVQGITKTGRVLTRP